MRSSTPYIYILLLFLFAACGPEQNLKRGNAYMAIGEYQAAATELKAAYRKTPPKARTQRGEIALQMGNAYTKIHAGVRAVAAYANAFRYGVSTPEARFAYARGLMQQGNYKRAYEELVQIQDSFANNLWFANTLKAATIGDEERKRPSGYTVKRMDLFNSRRADFAPMFFGTEGNLLYFTSTRNEAMGNELSGITGMKAGDLFFAEKDDRGRWSKPQPLQEGVNTDFDEGACAFSADGRTMFFTRCKSHPEYDCYATLFAAQRSDATWTKAEPVILSGDTLSSFAHPAPSPDGQWLYFAGDLPGGSGGFDIWRVRITTHGYGGVENLGSEINTPGDELFPSFRPNGDLYFSSDGHVGFGGLDIFIAKPKPDASGYELLHPGMPLNSSADDFGITFEGMNNRGFFSSNRNDARGWDHIYSFEKPEITQSIRGWVYEKDGYELPQAQVYMVGDDGTNEKITLKSDGSFTRIISPGVNYILLATCKGFLNHRHEMRVDSVKASKVYDLQFPLASITAPVLIDNILFDLDKATLRPESLQALDVLVSLLNDNPNVTIALSSSCDYRGERNYNLQLSQRRAESVVNYLIAKGIAKDRLTPIGHGEDVPKTVTKKLAEKYSFLKEGDVLTEDFILKRTPEQQEICNQLNRRTEFKVLRTTYNMFDDQGRVKEVPQTHKQQQSKQQATSLPIIIN